LCSLRLFYRIEGIVADSLSKLGSGGGNQLVFDSSRDSSPEQALAGNYTKIRRERPEDASLKSNADDVPGPSLRRVCRIVGE